MKTLNIFLSIIFCALLFTIINFSCNSNNDDPSTGSGQADDDSNVSDDDDSDDDDDDSCGDPIPGCEDIVQPVLLSVALMINGVEVQMPATVYTSDQVAIAFEYVDEDCNFGREGWYAQVNFGLNGEDSYRLRKLTGESPRITEDIPDAHECSSADMGGPYIFYFDPDIFLLPPEFEREHPYRFTISDSCGHGSWKDDYYVSQFIDFTVVEG